MVRARALKCGCSANGWTQTRSVFVTYEPTDGPIGVQIRMVLEHRVQASAATLAALFAADRADHLGQPKPESLRIWAQNTDVITDRYYLVFVCLPRDEC